MTYNFKETKLPNDFAEKKVAEFKALIELGQSFTVLSMPGVGVSYFLKYLTSKEFATFFHIDMYSLSALNQTEVYKLLYKELTGKDSKKTDGEIFKDCQKVLETLSREKDKIVLIFSRFDQLKKVFSREFLANLQSLTTISQGKIVLIFTSVLPLYELAAEAVTGGNLSFYSKVLYFKPFSKKELIELFTLDHTMHAHPELEKLADLAGGHSQLLHVFVNSHKQNNLLLDKFVTLQLKELINYLDYSQRKQVEKIALGKKVEEIDEYLLGVGFIGEEKSPNGSSSRLFSPLLEEYIKQNVHVKLPLKEAKLFKLLRNNIGKVVSKDEIFKEVWGENDENATDWALDALIYRLRKHPFMHSHGYIIESNKKVGYVLLQN